MESHKKDEDNGEDSKKTNWLEIFIVFRSRGFTDEEICQLSYPKFKAYLENLNNPLFFPFTIPYIGTGEKNEKGEIEETDENKITSREELMSIVASMNSDFR